MLRAQQLIRRLRNHRISKYNAFREYSGGLPQHYVLVVDQVRDGPNVKGGLAGEQNFVQMLECALAEHPDKIITVKPHPKHIICGTPGYYDSCDLKNNDRIVVLTETCHPSRLIENAQAVYCVTSQVGFEALLWGKPVHCFGMPFYAGWGLTRDMQPSPRRRQTRLL